MLTPGLVQMVSVLALNKLELREMINTEMVENPVLEEIEESSVTIEEMAGREGDRERSAEEIVSASERAEKDPFDEIDFGSYFQDYLDPGFRTASSFEDTERLSFDNFLSQPSTLSDHLEWQLGSMNLSPRLRTAADLVVGNLNEDGYLTASDEELADALLQSRAPARAEPIPFERGIKHRLNGVREAGPVLEKNGVVELAAGVAELGPGGVVDLTGAVSSNSNGHVSLAMCDERVAAMATVVEAREIINHLDPVGVGARDLRECLLIQIEAQRREVELMLKRAGVRKMQRAGDGSATIPRLSAQNGNGQHAASSNGSNASSQLSWRSGLLNGASSSETSAAGCGTIFETAALIVTSHLALLQKKDMRDLTRSCGRAAEEVQAAVDLIRTLDPRPGQRYNQSETRLIEPDVAFVKRDGEYVVVMNEEDMPTLRLSRGYRKMLREKQTEKDVREYVKERYKSAIQLLRNIEQRKNTILRTCEVIVRRQQDFLERGEQGLRPMMIKEVAEEIGVHPSTVSRAVANKYVHTSQGVYELRFFFTEGVNGPEGGDLPLVLLKRKVKKLIEDEDERKPLTDDQLAAELQRQGIRVTRRTVAKYREDMQIPSTHQRRVR